MHEAEAARVIIDDALLHTVLLDEENDVIVFGIFRARMMEFADLLFLDAEGA